MALQSPSRGGLGVGHTVGAHGTAAVVAMSPESQRISLNSQKYLCSFHDTKLEILGPTSPLNQAREGHARITPWGWELTAGATTIFQPFPLAWEPAKVQLGYVWQVNLRKLSSTN